MKVVFDGEEREVRAGVSVEGLLSEEQRRAAAAGELFVADAWGQRVGLEGALTDGAAYFAVRAGARPPSVNACLEALGRREAVNLPADLAKHLVHRAIETFRKGGGAASAEGTAAFAAATAAREDAAALWGYVAGGAKAVYVYEAGKARLRELAPDVRAVVVATRDVLTFRTGLTTLDYLDGIRVVEVGTTNKVKLADYEAAFGDVDGVVACRAGDFAMEGFVDAAADAELSTAAAAAGLRFARVLADAPLFDERGAPERPEEDVVICSTPPEARSYDLAFNAVPLDKAAGDAARYEEAAKSLWRFLKEGVG
jgi:hypothetical protein